MNGFYPVLNEIHDKAARELPLAELALFEHIWRKLIGWNQFEDEISIGQLVKETKASRATIIRLVKKLEDKRWIIVTRQFSKVNRKFTNKIAIPPCPSIKMRLGWYQNDTRGSVKSILGGSVKMRHTTDSIPKDSLKTAEQQIPPTPQNKVTTGIGGDSDSENGGGVLAKGKKPEDEAQTVLDELRYHRVNDPVRSEIVAKYETRYIYRQILQMRKDFLRGIVFNNPGGALVARIRSGHRTEDYPE